MPSYNEFIQMFDREIEYRERELERFKIARQALLLGKPSAKKKAAAKVASSNGHVNGKAKAPPGTLTLSVLDYIKAHPGSNGVTIARGLGFKDKETIRVYGPLRLLREQQAVRCEGEAPQFAYFPSEVPEEVPA